MNKRAKIINFTTQRGVTLVELMVSLAIGLAITLFVSSLFLSSRGSYRTNDENSRMQEEGRAALFVLGRNLMQAGYGVATVSSPSADLSRSMFENLTDVDGNLEKFRACQYGFAGPSAQNFTCAGSGTPGFEVAYVVDYSAAGATDNVAAGTDCNGQRVKYKRDNTEFDATPSDKWRYALNRFYVENGTLFCAGNGSTVPQPLLGGTNDMQVLDMQLRYGVNTNSGTSGTTDFNNGYKSVDDTKDTQSQVEALTDKWKSVVRVEVCLEIAGTSQVASGAQTYVDCSDNVRTLTGSNVKQHVILRGVYTLRNNASPRNFAM